MAYMQSSEIQRCLGMSMITFFINEVKHQSIDIGDMDRYHFEFLQPILEHKRFVFLGESSHCVKEYSLAKVSLIKSRVRQF